MYIAMNRFHINIGREEAFIDFCQNHEIKLKTIPGFIQFYLLEGKSDKKSTLFIAHSSWNSIENYLNWSKSDAFQKALENIGNTKILYHCQSQFEDYDVVL